MNILISQGGADANIQDVEGITALHWACSVGSLEAVQLLLHMGANFNVMEVDGEKLTPLDYAIIGSHQEVAQLLIEQGALSVSSIRELAATMIQRCVRGYLVRKKYGPQLAKRKAESEDARMAEARAKQDAATVGSAGSGRSKQDEVGEVASAGAEEVDMGVAGTVEGSREASRGGVADREDKTAERMR